MPFKVIQGHRFGYQSKAHMQLPVVINTNLPPILHCFQVMVDYWVKFSLATGGGASLERPQYWGWPAANIPIKFTSAETRRVVLPDSIDRAIACSFIYGQNTGTWRKDRHTDRRTDGHICRGYYSGLHCERCGRAV